MTDRPARRRIWMTALAALTLLTAGCAPSESESGSPSASSGTDTTQNTDSPSSTNSSSGAASPSATVPPSESASTSPASPTTTPAAIGPCRADQLQLSVGSTGGAAGTIYTTFVVVNTSGATCTLLGYPAVAFVDAAGTQVGPAATRTNDSIAPAAVSLAPTNAAHFIVANSNVIPQAGCPAAVTAPTMRMTPPESANPLTVAAPTAGGFEVCNPSVGPLRAGASE